MPPILALLGIDNRALVVTIQLAGLFLVLIWLALVYFTWADARRRIGDRVLVGTAAITALLLPFAGTIVYLVVRPSEHLDDVRARELGIRAAEARLAASGVLRCPHCDYGVQREFLRCPSCLHRLRQRCEGCGQPRQPEWRACPYCTETADPPLRRGRRRGQLA